MASADQPARACMLVTPTLDRAAMRELADEVTELVERAVREGIRRGGVDLARQREHS